MDNFGSIYIDEQIQFSTKHNRVKDVCTSLQKDASSGFSILLALRSVFRKCSAEIILMYVPDLCLTSSQLYEPNVMVILKCICHLDYVESPQNIHIYKTDSTDVVFYVSGQNGSYTTFLVLSEILFLPVNPVTL